MDKTKYLYHYMGTKVERICSAVVQNKLYFTSPKKFNDPFDCATTIKFSDAKEDVLKQYYHHLMKGKYKRKGINRTDEEIQIEAEYGIAKQKHKNAVWLNECSHEIKKEVKKHGETLRVFCLTEKPKNILMWSHYANKHKGIVLQFDRSRILNENGEDRCFSVSYKVNFPSVKEYMAAVNSNNYLEFAKLFHCRKAKCWRYECEWRIFQDKKVRVVDMPDGVLTGIIFGCKTSKRIKEQITAWNLLREYPLKIYHAKQGADSFELIVTSDDGKRL